MAFIFPLRGKQILAMWIHPECTRFPHFAFGQCGVFLNLALAIFFGSRLNSCSLEFFLRILLSAGAHIVGGQLQKKQITMDPDGVAKAFVEHYYNTFDSNRANLAALYQEGSMLTFEGQKIQGVQPILAKLTGLPFQQCKHNIITVDCQPSGPAGGMLVFVSGRLQLPGEEHQLKFSQLFHLMPAQGSFYVLNDIFRLNYA